MEAPEVQAPPKQLPVELNAVNLQNVGTFKLKDSDGKRAVRVALNSNVKAIIIQKMPKENNKIVILLET